MACYIVTENDADADLLFELLKPEFLRWASNPNDSVVLRRQGELRLAQSTTRSGAVSLARTILFSSAEPVALVVNAQTIFEAPIAEQRRYLESELRVGSPGVGRKVFIAVPELQICVFQDRQLAEKLFKTEFSDLEWKDAMAEPKRWVNILLTDQRLPQWIAQHDDAADVIQQLREMPLLAELREFVESNVGQKVA